MGDTHRFALRVYFEDTDVAGIVYYANYLRFMERARSDMLRALGIDQRAALEGGEGVYVVAEAQIKYRRPAKLDDALRRASARSRRCGRRAASFISESCAGDEILADATITAAFLSPEGRPQRQPRAWVETVRAAAKEGE